MNATPEQLAAVSSLAPEILLLACPGAGKTTTLIERIAQLPKPDQGAAIVVTFTNKAAAQLRDKLAARTIRVHFVGTLHGLAARILAANGQRPAVITQEQQDDILKELITSLRSKVSLKAVRSALLGKPGPKEEAVVAAYRKRLREADAYDYDALLAAGAQFAAAYNRHPWHLFVDEYQDSGPVDDGVYNTLPCASRFFVGDPDQGIYSFRGATRENLLRRMGTADVLRLTTNFRSRPEIVDAANHLMDGDPHHRTMQAIRPGIGGVKIKTFPNHHAELAAIVQRVAAEANAGEEWAVLTRYNHTRRDIDDALRAAGAPMPAKPAPRPGDQRVVEAWLALLASPNNRLAQADYLRATCPADEAQSKIESGIPPKTEHRPFFVWPDLLSHLKVMRLSQGTILRTYTAWLDAGPEPRDILAALREEPPVEKVFGAVTVTTLHGAKGLEFDNVWLPALEDIRDSNRDEERRLFYVGMTRAKNTLIMSAALTRQNAYTGANEKPKRSPFLLDLE